MCTRARNTRIFGGVVDIGCGVIKDRVHGCIGARTARGLLGFGCAYCGIGGKHFIASQTSNCCCYKNNHRAVLAKLRLPIIIIGGRLSILQYYLARAVDIHHPNSIITRSSSVIACINYLCTITRDPWVAIGLTIASELNQSTTIWVSRPDLQRIYWVETISHLQKYYSAISATILRASWLREQEHAWYKEA